MYIRPRYYGSGHFCKFPPCCDCFDSCYGRGLEINLNTRESHGLSRDNACKEGRHRTSSLRFLLCAGELFPELGKMTRVFIGRLSMSARESDVERFLRGYGKVRDISLKRGYGFVVRRIWIVPCRFAMKSFFCDLLSLASTFYL